jgi:hypothetical protein
MPLLDFTGDISIVLGMFTCIIIPTGEMTWVRFPAGEGISFLFVIASRPLLWPTQDPVQWVPEDLSLRVKRLGREADHLPPSSKGKVR